MSGSSNQRYREDRGEEAYVSSLQGVELSQENALRMVTVAQVAANQQKVVEGVTSSLPPPLPTDAAGACRKGKGVDFDASTEQPVLKGGLLVLLWWAKPFSRP
ncbi:hypothetical protein ACOSP7_012487 [Xanthoceras sorbifolium]